MGISGSIGKPLSKPPFSNIRDHHQSSGHPISPDDFSILSSCSSSFELLLRECLLISKLKPSLNANLSSVPLTLYIINPTLHDLCMSCIVTVILYVLSFVIVKSL